MVAAPPPRPVFYHLPLPDASLRVTLHEPDARVSDVPESVVQDLWQHLRFDTAGLQTVEGASLQVLHPGIPNRHGGPDFSEARILVGGKDGEAPVLLVGDVEIHRTSGEWNEHRHEDDPRYDRVVLHVVLLGDRHTGTLRRPDGTPLPEVLLYDRLQEPLRRLLYRFFSQPGHAFACAPHVPSVPADLRRTWTHRLGIERLERRAARLMPTDGCSLDQVFYGALLRALGHAPNADAMQNLALRVPLSVARRALAEGGPREVEALLFGAAGFIPAPSALRTLPAETAWYAADLGARFERHVARQPIRSMSPVEWQFFRLRPANFPTRRIAQAAALVGGLLADAPFAKLHGALGDPRPLRALRTLLGQHEAASFWAAHTRLDKPSKPLSTRVGRARVDGLLLNAVLPILLLDADIRGDGRARARVLEVFEQLPPADDETTRAYRDAGFSAEAAVDTQGLVRLRREYCDAGRCLSCAIGRHVLAREDGP
jgi:hypothetical protein